jgi:hypothetical protein
MPSTRKDCVPDAEIPVQMKRVRKYSGPVKGSQEAKDRMARVRAAQWAKNGLVVSNASDMDDPAHTSRAAPNLATAHRT